MEMKGMVCKVVDGGGLIQWCRKPKFGSLICPRKLELFYFEAKQSVI